MSKKQIVLEHRQALDIVETATSSYNTCRRKGECGDGTKCLTCPARNNLLQAKATLEEKSHALNQFNKQIIKRNDTVVLQQLDERKEARLKKGMEKTSAPTYKREDLTPERYLNHKNLDEFTDTKIREMYDYPKTTFEQWKRDNNLVRNYKKGAAPAEKVDAPQQRKYDKLKLEHDSLKVRYDETAERCRKLEQELVIEREAHTMKSDLLNLLEKKLAVEKETSATKSELLLSLEADIKKLEQELQAHKDACGSKPKSNKVEASNECATCKELATLLQQRDEQDEELADAINKQMERFDQYEDYLFDRIKQLKHDARSNTK